MKNLHQIDNFLTYNRSSASPKLQSFLQCGDDSMVDRSTAIFAALCKLLYAKARPSSKGMSLTSSLMNIFRIFFLSGMPIRTAFLDDLTYIYLATLWPSITLPVDISRKVYLSVKPAPAQVFRQVQYFALNLMSKLPSESKNYVNFSIKDLISVVNSENILTILRDLKNRAGVSVIPCDKDLKDFNTAGRAGSTVYVEGDWGYLVPSKKLEDTTTYVDPE